MEQETGWLVERSPQRELPDIQERNRSREHFQIRETTLPRLQVPREFLLLGLQGFQVSHLAGDMHSASVPGSPADGKENAFVVANTRRRSVVVQEKLVVNRLAEAGLNGVAGDGVLANGKDSSHTIRGDSAPPDRLKDPFQVKKGLVSSPITYRRKKTSRPETPKWQSVLSITTKACLLLAAILWMGQGIWSWISVSRGDSSMSPYAAMDYDGRISDVEASLKKSVNMLQLQVEVVDKKVGSEIKHVTRELTKQIEEKEAMLQNEFRRLEAKTDSIGWSLDEVKDSDLLSKGEFESFLDEFRKSKNYSHADGDLSLDEVRSFARDIVREEIDKHAADGLGRVDYALYSGGARVVKHSIPYYSGKPKIWTPVKGLNGIDPNARKILEPSFGEPGQCFPLQGSSGFVEIRLRKEIIPEAVTLEHVSKAVAFDRSSAPRDCRVLGWFQSPDDGGHTAKEGILAEFYYDLQKSNAQTFDVVEKEEPAVVNMIRLKFSSNQGNPYHTCIYRFRVHGREPSLPVPEL